MMSMLKSRVADRLLLTLLLGSVVGLGGCFFLDDFPRVGPDEVRDDDDSNPDDDDDDDDDDATGERAPEITIDGIDPLTIPVSGVIRIMYTVNDPDSEGYSLLGSWIDAEGVERPTTLVGGTGADLNEFDQPVVAGAPPIDESAEISWNSVADVPTTAGNVVIQVCVTDSDGNEGNCDTYPDTGGISLQNTLESGLGEFCQPGDLEVINWLGGRSVVPLAPGDGSCPNYQKTDPPVPDDFAAQFMVVMINPLENEMAFTISATDQPTILGPPEQSAGPAARELDPDADSSLLRVAPAADQLVDDQDGLAMQGLTDALREMALEDYSPGYRMGAPSIVCTEDLFADDVNSDARTFFFRETLDPDPSRQTRGANLRALGDHVAIYVDDETPIDIDEDCADPTNPVTPGELPAFNFTNCDLENIVDVVEDNIWPTLTGLFGEPSDVDENCRVTIFLSHRLNKLTSTDSDNTNDAFTVRSFAEPDIDLWQSNLTANPNSNEQEILFVYAPDPVGFWSDQLVSLEDYLSYELAGRIAIGLFDLISYASHRGVGKVLLDKTNPKDLALPPAEEDWLNDALGLLAADLTGFGAIAFQDAWTYMDRPHLLELEAANLLSDFEDRGGQYLFARYLADLYGDGAVGVDMYDLLMNSGCVGSDNVSNLIIQADGGGGGDDDDSAGGDDDDSAGGGGGESECTGDDEVFEEFVLQWATAMSVSGRTIADTGVQLVADTVVTNYQTSSPVIVQDPENPQPGELFGANGFQQGFNVRDLNITYTGGTDPAGATALTDLNVRTGNLDVLMFHPQSDFFGVVAGNYGVVAVLISGLEQPENYLLIETALGEPLVGNVIRINDSSPHEGEQRLTLEDVDGAKLTTVRDLGLLELFEERNLIGRIDGTESVPASPSIEPPDLGDDDDSAGVARADDDDSGEEEEPSELEVADTDRFRFTLDNQQLVGIWVDRRVSQLSGIAELQDPFLAVMPVEDVPDAFDYSLWGFGPSTGPCFDPALYTYPVIMPGWLGPQANLIPDPTAGPQSNFEILASVPGSDVETFECLHDHDQDGIADVDESAPENLAQQIILRQAENLAMNPAWYENTFDILAPPADALDVTGPFFGPQFIDIDSNESPDDGFATSVRQHNIGGRQIEEGEEAVWFGYLPAGEYMIIVGDASGSEGPYDLSLRVLVAP